MRRKGEARDHTRPAPTSPPNTGAAASAKAGSRNTFGSSARAASDCHSAVIRASSPSGRHSTRKSDSIMPCMTLLLRAAPDEDVKAQPALGHLEQQDGFDGQCRGGGGGGAGGAEQRNERETSAEIDREGRPVDERANALLAQHVE